MKITYAITACNEHAELERLLHILRDTIREQDEVIIQLDVNYTEQVLEICNLFTNFNHEGSLTHAIKQSKFYAYPLDNDFARFKNNLSQNATGDYIFQLDADEYVHPTFINDLPEFLELNSRVDLFLVPRVNTVDGLTPEHIQKWGWRVDGNGWVNWPDFQTRIYKNVPGIKWINKVHERLVGHKEFTYLPLTEEYALHHPKTIERQEKQNKYYDTL